MAVKKLPPHSADAERAVLGSMLIDTEAIHRVSPLVQPGDFHLRQHQLVFRAMLDLDGTPTDFLAVCDQLERNRKLDAIGGEVYLTQLISDLPTSLHAEHYARIVADYAIRRKLIQAGGEIVQKAWSTNGDGDNDPLSFAQKAIMDISGHRPGGLMPVPDAVGELFDQVEYWQKHPLKFGEVRGLATGLKELDDALDGMEPGNLILMAGRPSMGKSALAFEIARRVALAGRETIVFALEMTTAEVLGRWASAMSGVNIRKVKRGSGGDRGHATPDEMGKFMAALGQMAALENAAIDDTPGLTCAEIRSRALARAQRVGGLDLVVVDHSGLITPDGYGENAVKAEGRKSQVMKELAKELACPTILVQQLNRAVENRAEKIPTLADLRDSGEHEQNADVVLALYRDSYYKKNVEEGSKEDLALDVLVLKHRDGARHQKSTLMYERHLSRFNNPALPWQKEPPR